MKINYANAPVSDFGTLSRDLEDFFGGFLKPERHTGKTENSFNPQSDVFEDEHGYSISLDLPGVDKSEVKINFENDVLSIEGERLSPGTDDSRKYYRVERQFGFFKRTFTFRKAIDSKKIKADFLNGVLTIVVPKAAEGKAREIKIQ